MSRSVRAAVADAFGDPRQADCVVRFYLANDPINHDGLNDIEVSFTNDYHPPARGASAVAANGNLLTLHARRFLGPPLPAHRLIVCGGSELLQAQLERWQDPGGRARACLAANGGQDNAKRSQGRLPPAGNHPVANTRGHQHDPHEQQQQQKHQQRQLQHEGHAQHAAQDSDGSDGQGTVRLRLEVLEAGATTTTTTTTGLAHGTKNAAVSNCHQQKQPRELLVRARILVLPRPATPPPSSLPSDALHQPSIHQHPSCVSTTCCSRCATAATPSTPSPCCCQWPHPDALPTHLRLAPELLVPLGSESELRPALAALRYMYTGRVDLARLEGLEGLEGAHPMGSKQAAVWAGAAGAAAAGTLAGSEGGSSSSSPMVELLAVRHAGAYLHVAGCGAACDEAMRELLLAGRLSAPASARTGGRGGSSSSSKCCCSCCGGDGGGGGGGSCGRHADALRYVRELYTCRHMLPDAREDPEFARTVLAAALWRVLHDFADDVRAAMLDGQVGHRQGAGGAGDLVGLQLGQQQHVPGQLWRPWLAPPSPPPVVQIGAGAAAEAPGGMERRVGEVAEGEASRGDLLAWLLGGDVLAILNSPDRLREVLALPCVAMEELLSSQHLGTDDEGSVLVLVEKWVVANGAAAGGSGGTGGGGGGGVISNVERHGGRSASGRELTTGRARLRQLVRLVNVNLSYMTDVVPKLEAWVGSSGAGAADMALLLGRYARSTGEERKRLAELYGKRYDMTKAWFSTDVRPQCVPEEGLSFEWEVSAGQLEGLLQQPKAQTMFASIVLDRGISMGSTWSEGDPLTYGTTVGSGATPCQCCRLRCTLHTKEQQPGSSIIISSSSSAPVYGERVTVGGYEWRVGIQAKQGDRAAGVFLFCYLPYAVQQQTGLLDGAAQVAARLEVYGRPCTAGAGRGGTASAGQREVMYCMEYRGRDGFVGYGDGWGNRRALPLAVEGGSAGVEGTVAGGGGDEVSMGHGHTSGLVQSCGSDCLQMGDEAAGCWAWAQYLLPGPGGDRRLCGRLTFLRPT